MEGICGARVLHLPSFMFVYVLSSQNPMPESLGTDVLQTIIVSLIQVQSLKMPRILGWMME